MIRVLLADQIADVVDDLAMLSRYASEIEICGIANHAAAVIEEAWLRQPDVLVLRDTFGDLPAPSLARQLESVSPLTRLLVIAPATPMEPGNGITAVVPGTADGTQLLAAIRVAAGLIPPAPPPLETAAAPAPLAPPPLEPPPVGPPAIDEPAPTMATVEPPRPVRQPPRGRGQILVVFSGKGGVGTSMIAANLAVAMSHGDAAPAALVDVDLQFGDAAVLLHVESHLLSIEDLTQQGDDIDPAFLDDAMATGPGDVRVLRSPSSPELADLVTASSLRSILRATARSYADVVVDAPSNLDERTLEALELADRILVVSSFNVASVRSTKVSLRLLQALGIDRDRIDVVLNQTRPRVSFKRGEIEEILRCRVLVELPYDPRLDESLDAGTPIVLMQPRAELSRRLLALADQLTSHAADQGLATYEIGDAMPLRLNRRRFSLGRR